MKEKTMKAVIQTAPNELAYSDVPMPEIEEPTDAILRFTLGTICTSDIHMQPLFFGEQVVGHEFCGEVVEIGSDVKKTKVGQRYLVKPAPYCGECDMCKYKQYTMCENAGAFSVLGRAGVFSEYVRVPYADNSLVAIPEGCTEEDVIMNADVLTTGRFLVEDGGVKEGDIVAILGVGPIGMSACMLAKQRFGAKKVIAIDINEERLQLCREHNIADYFINPATEDLSEQIDELTDGQGVDFAGDTTASPDFLRTLILIARSRGTIATIGTTLEDITFPLNLMMGKNLSFRAGTQDFTGMEEMQEMIGKHEIDVKWMLTHRKPMNDTIEGYKVFGNHEDNVIKWLIQPWDHSRD